MHQQDHLAVLLPAVLVADAVFFVQLSFKVSRSAISSRVFDLARLQLATGGRLATLGNRPQTEHTAQDRPCQQLCVKIHACLFKHRALRISPVRARWQATRACPLRIPKPPATATTRHSLLKNSLSPPAAGSQPQSSRRSEIRGLGGPVMQRMSQKWQPRAHCFIAMIGPVDENLFVGIRLSPQRWESRAQPDAHGSDADVPCADDTRPACDEADA